MFSIVKIDVAQQQAAFVARLVDGVERVLRHACVRTEDALLLCEYLDCLKARMPGVSRKRMAAAGQALEMFGQCFGTAEEIQSLRSKSPAAERIFSALDTSWPVLQTAKRA